MPRALHQLQPCFICLCRSEYVGYIKNASTAPLQTGELRLLGHTLSPELASVFCGAAQDNLAESFTSPASPDRLQLLRVVIQHQGDHCVHCNVPRRLEAAIKEWTVRYRQSQS